MPLDLWTSLNSSHNKYNNKMIYLEAWQWAIPKTPTCNNSKITPKTQTPLASWTSNQLNNNHNKTTLSALWTKHQLNNNNSLNKIWVAICSVGWIWIQASNNKQLHSNNKIIFSMVYNSNNNNSNHLNNNSRITKMHSLVLTNNNKILRPHRRRSQLSGTIHLICLEIYRLTPKRLKRWPPIWQQADP